MEICAPLPRTVLQALHGSLPLDAPHLHPQAMRKPPSYRIELGRSLSIRLIYSQWLLVIRPTLSGRQVGYWESPQCPSLCWISRYQYLSNGSSSGHSRMSGRLTDY
ncbi:hypothetical protein QCA50_009732 [Cerrena zonata]|uniref:Uncharacterized protein n=1 Tax=Cerrena zonata TaxID=2478898 RepID=A0AAW0G6V6_9APHY